MGILTREINSQGFKGAIIPVVAHTDYENALGDVTKQCKLGNNKLYITTISGINSIASVGKQWTPVKHNQSFMVGQIEIPVYNLNAHYEYDRVQKAMLDETLNGANAGVSVEDMYNRLCLQGIALKTKAGTLWGFDAGEGILAGATEFTFGNDGSGGDKITTFNLGILVDRIVAMATDVVDATKNTQSHISILFSQQTYNYLATSMIKLSQGYIQSGSTTNALSLIKKRVEELGRECLIGYEPSFANADSTGQKDVIFVNAPGLKMEQQEGIARDLNSVGMNGSQITFNSFIDIGTAGVYREVDPYHNGLWSGNWYSTQTCGATVRANTAMVAYVAYQ